MNSTVHAESSYLTKYIFTIQGEWVCLRCYVREKNRADAIKAANNLPISAAPNADVTADEGATDDNNGSGGNGGNGNNGGGRSGIRTSKFLISLDIV